MQFKKNGFTLVELLVVITIISLLVGLLLPVLEDSIESARRVQCLSQLRQQYMAIQSYSNAYDGLVPTIPVWKHDSSSGAGDSRYKSVVGGINPNPTGWYVLEQAGFIDKWSLVCPSGDTLGDFNNYNVYGVPTVHTNNGYWGIDYGYRYNTGNAYRHADQGTGPIPPFFGRNILSKREPWRILLVDATAYTVPYDSVYHTINLVSEHAQHRWSHEEGGNFARHDGSARWLENQPPMYLYWPTYNVSTFYSLIEKNVLGLP